ncbi:MAG TPA: LamG domain-containing protein, partial [Lentisphaeria bacterium]|nr:LamG domain-containing protein [Lentisphaeria bacterium]
SVLVENQNHFFADQITGGRAEIRCSLKNKDQLSGKPATDTGLKGMAFRAGGSSQYGRFLELHTELLQSEKPFTIVLWFKSLAIQHSTCLLYYKNFWFSKPGFMLRMDGSQLRLLVVPEAEKSAVCIASNRPLNPIQMNTWYFVALSWDGNGWTMHMNGEKLPVEAADFANVSPNTPLRIGGYNILTNNIFQGLIDECRIFRGALSTAEILDLLAADIQPSVPEDNQPRPKP